MTHPLGLFDGFGVELEYMIVDRATLAIRPYADRLIELAGGKIESEIARGGFAWSNELVLHVIEFKTNGPASGLGDLAVGFQAEVEAANRLLEPLQACLLPTAMHPTMAPERDTRLWPHEYNAVYEAFDRIFDCHGHGWANVQSMHLNLPFADDDEFGRLHEAIRIMLPLIPALTASSPVADGNVTGLRDTRMAFYRDNARRVPSITGAVVPESVRSRREYEARILEPIYRDLAPLDPTGTLRHEWVNARGAIARFDRGAVEIRVVDVQECPLADLAVAAAISAVVGEMTGRDDAWRRHARGIPTATLSQCLNATIEQGEQAIIADPDYLRVLGWHGPPPSAAELWTACLERASEAQLAPFRAVLDVIASEGCLATRIIRHLASDRSPERLLHVYRQLASCLAEGKVFRGND